MDVLGLNDCHTEKEAATEKLSHRLVEVTGL